MKMMLQILNQNTAISDISVDSNCFIIGRAKDCRFCYPDKSVNEYHCAIINDNDSFFIRDLNSSTGVFLNGKRVEYEEKLKNDDQIVIGTLTMKVMMSVPDEQSVFQDSLGQNSLSDLVAKLVDQNKLASVRN